MTSRLTQNMEITSVILCLFGGLLFLRFSLTCDRDSDCRYTGDSCCKYTETGKKLETGLCVLRNCGAGVCRTQADCFPEKRCDTSSIDEFRCTKECFRDDHCQQMYGSHSGYICTYNEDMDQNHCIKWPPTEDSGDNVGDSGDNVGDVDSGAVKYILITLAVIAFCLICACLRRRSMGRNVRREMATQPSNTLSIGTTNAQERRNIERPVERPATLQITPNQTQIEHSNSLPLDAIAKSGPPSYMEVRDIPESPPPTYEQATKA